MDVKLGEAEKRRQDAFEMSCYRRIFKIKLVNETTNGEVLERIWEKRTLWNDKFSGDLYLLKGDLGKK